jgi:glucosyl-3-phosphoglycerate synthase
MSDAIRTFPAGRVTVEHAVGAKRGRTVSVCVPCRNEGATIGRIVEETRHLLMERHHFVDELVVIDDRSTDDTAAVAADAGARVVPIEEIHRIHGTAHGKGNALWASLIASHGDIVVWCDGDVVSFTPEWIVRLAVPLLEHDDVALVKAMYHRPTTAGGGGRTTELVARPALSMLAPDIAGLAQPLAGEYAGRRTVMEAIPFACGWGAEIAMLLDIAERHGAAAIGQVDLGERHHRHQPLAALALQAAEVLATVLARTGRAPLVEELRLAGGDVHALNLDERPPIEGLRRDGPPA